MNILEKKLQEKATDAVKEQTAIVNEAKLLLADNAKEEIKLLKGIGLDFEVNIALQKQEEITIRNSQQAKLEKTIVTRAEILDMCETYRLYLRPARHYRGRIPADLGAELVRFCSEKNIPIPGHLDYSRFHIIAPPKMFAGYKSPGENLGAALIAYRSEKEEQLRRKNEDPILVYELQESGYFAIIKSWGDDMTWLRRVYSIATKSLTMALFFLALHIICFALPLICGWFTYVKIDAMGGHIALSSIIGVCVAVLGYITLGNTVWSVPAYNARIQLMNRVCYPTWVSTR
jgi:hypothetical protein